MSTHITTPPRAEQAEPEAAEPARRATRFDQRGIALQTIIIMVVLLAIAGAVAAVLFNRASTETARLEGSEDTFVYAIGDRLQCQSLGHNWKTTVPVSPHLENMKAALGTTKTLTKATTTNKSGTETSSAYYIDGYCEPDS